MTFRLQLKKLKKKQGHTRAKFDLEKLKDPGMAQVFEAKIGRKFAPLMLLDTDNTGTDTLIDTFNTAVIETAGEVFGKKRITKKPWVTPDLYNCVIKGETSRRPNMKVRRELTSTGRQTSKSR